MMSLPVFNSLVEGWNREGLIVGTWLVSNSNDVDDEIVGVGVDRYAVNWWYWECSFLPFWIQSISAWVYTKSNVVAASIWQITRDSRAAVERGRLSGTVWTNIIVKYWLETDPLIMRKHECVIRFSECWQCWNVWQKKINESKLCFGYELFTNRKDM